MFYIYVLRLVEDKDYVGKAVDPHARFENTQIVRSLDRQKEYMKNMVWYRESALYVKKKIDGVTRTFYRKRYG